MKTTACRRSTSRGRRSRCLAAATPWATAAQLLRHRRAGERLRVAERADGLRLHAGVGLRPRGLEHARRRLRESPYAAVLRLDQVNEGDKTEARLSEWLDILAGEGFFGGDATAAPAPAPAAAAPAAAPRRRRRPGLAAAAVGAAPEPAVVDAVRGLLPDVGADPAKPYILTNENLVQLLMAQHNRLQRALRKIQELEGGVLVVPAAAPVEKPCRTTASRPRNWTAAPSRRCGSVT